MNPAHREGYTIFRYAGNALTPDVANGVVARSRAFFGMANVRSFVPNDFTWEFGDFDEESGEWLAKVEHRDDSTDEILAVLEFPAPLPLRASGAGVWRDGLGVKVKLHTGARRNRRQVVGHWKVVPYITSSGSGTPSTATLAALQTAVRNWLVATLAAGFQPVVFRRASSVEGPEVLPVLSVTVPPVWTQMTRRRRRLSAPALGRVASL